jgi:chromate reductase
MKKLIALGGSNSKNSINRRLAWFTAGLFTKYEKELIDLNDFPMPLFSLQLEEEIGSPPSVDQLIKKISEADFIVLCLAENNRIYNAGFKSAFDWLSRKTPKVFQNRPMLLMASSTGKRGGASVLEFAKGHLPNYGADVKAIFSFPSFNENFRDGEGITNKELLEQLKEVVNKLESEI